ncbi:MAG: hypothetical protein GYB68_11880 [Chloroflexi bacterium]|nr:hypothetical protein [Chloroflexota bacterium]
MLSPRAITWVLVGVVIVQVFDVAIHIAVDQFEPIRVVSNLTVAAWVGVVLFGWLAGQERRLGIAALGLYVLLNVGFVATQGVINEVTGEFRTLLFILVAVTGALAAWVIASFNKDDVAAA